MFGTRGLSGLGPGREVGSDVGPVHLNLGWLPIQWEHLWEYRQFLLLQNAPAEL